MALTHCNLVPWKKLPTLAKMEFPDLSGKGSDFFHYDNEWYCIDYLDSRCDTHDYENHTMKGTIISCNLKDSSIIIEEEYTLHYVSNISQLLALH